MPYTQLRAELDRLSAGIWDDVTLVRQTGKPWQLGEVTVTERLHLDLLHSGHLTAMVSYRIPKEKLTGSDWEWKVQVPGTKTFLTYRIQAKILAPHSTAKRPLRFQHIDYPKETSQQRRTLINQAAADGAIPYYAFYVGDPWPKKEAVDLPPQWARAANVSARDYGCTVMHAGVVDAVNSSHPSRVDKKSANNYLGYDSGNASLQLSDLFLFGAGSSGLGGAGGAGPSGPGGPSGSYPGGDGGGTLNGNQPKKLTDTEWSLLEAIQAGRSPRVNVQELPKEEAKLEVGQLRLTAYFTV